MIQCALFCKGYAAGGITGIYYTSGVNAVKKMQENAGLEVTGKIDWKVWSGLLSLNWFTKVSGGDSNIVLIQQQLNSDWSDVIGVGPCDGIASRQTILSLVGALTYNGKVFDISYNAGNCPRTGTQEYLCWSIGRKFYYDFTTCGFLSVWERSPYGGQVHCRPEILWDIDNLLRLNLSEEWEQSHFPYEIVAQVNGSDIVFDGDDDQSDKDKVLMYLTMAYDTAFGEPFEHILLMKNGIQISPDRIIEIKPLTCWR